MPSHLKSFEDTVERTALGAQRRLFEVAEGGHEVLSVGMFRRKYERARLYDEDFYAKLSGERTEVVATVNPIGWRSVPIMADSSARQNGGLHRQIARIGSGTDVDRIPRILSFANKFGLLREHYLWDAEEIGLRRDFTFDLLSEWMDFSFRIAAFVALLDLLRNRRPGEDGIESMFYQYAGDKNGEWMASLAWDGLQLAAVGGNDQSFEDDGLFEWPPGSYAQNVWIDPEWLKLRSRKPIITQRYEIAEYFLSQEISMGLERNITLVLDPLRSRKNAQTIYPLNLEGAVWLYFANEFTNSSMSGRWCGRPGCEQPLPSSARSNRMWCSDKCKQWWYDERKRIKTRS